YAVGEVAADAIGASDGGGKPGLAYPTGPHDRDQPGAAEQCFDSIEVVGPPDEPGERARYRVGQGRRVRRRGRRRLQRREAGGILLGSRLRVLGRYHLLDWSHKAVSATE